LPSLLSGLEEIHRSDFLHRDIKPGNIYLRDKDNSPVLLDFGSARYAAGSRSHSITAVVSEGYSPFEMYQNDDTQNQGAWTDIYALAATLYKCVSGQTPPSAPARVSAKLNNKPDPLVTLEGTAGFSSKLLSGLMWGLCLQEKARPQSISEWREALLLESTSDNAFIKPEPLLVQSQSRWGLWLGIGILCIIALNGTFLFWLANQKQTSEKPLNPDKPPVQPVANIAEPNFPTLTSQKDDRFIRLNNNGDKTQIYQEWECIYDTETSLVWELKKIEGSRSYQKNYDFDIEHNELLHELNKIKLCGYDTWRVPTDTELSLLRSHKKSWDSEKAVTGKVYLDPNFFPYILELNKPIYWSSTPVYTRRYQAKSVDFSKSIEDQEVLIQNKSEKAYLRLVTNK
jgi:serine/threonine protein kinase